MPDFAFTRLGCDSGKMIDLTENLMGFADDSRSGFSEAHFALGPVEQLDAQFFFQLADLLTQRRLADVEAYGGATKVQLFGDGDKITQVAQLHQLPNSFRAPK
jgi:hypothetical protein